MTKGNNDLKGLPQISASKLKTWKTCQRKYFYTYIEKPPLEHREERNVGALLGTVLHKVIERRYKDPNINPLSLYQEKMFGTLEEWQKAGYKIIGEQHFSKQVKDGREILQKFDWDRFTPIELEKYFSLPFPDKQAPFAKITGYIDLIDRKDSTTFYVVDHKSQKLLPSLDEMANDAQFILYRWAFFEFAGFYPDAVLWNDLRTGKVIDTGVEEDYIEKLDRLIEDIHAMLNAQEYPKIELGDTCRKRCEFFKLCWSGEDDVSAL